MKDFIMKASIRSLINRYIVLIRVHHEAVGSFSTFAGAFVAFIGLIISLLAFWAQFSATSISREQLAAQIEQNARDRENYENTRRTELAKIIFDKSSHASLKSYAINELLQLWSGPFAKPWNEREYAGNKWSEFRKEKDIKIKIKSLSKISTWQCEERYDGGGDDGYTDRRLLNLRGVDLSNADLSNRNIKCVDFTGADLSSVNFTNSYLDSVLMDSVNLRGSNFDGLMASWSFISIDQNDPDYDKTANALSSISGFYLTLPCSKKNSSADRFASIYGDCKP